MEKLKSFKTTVKSHEKEKGFSRLELNMIGDNINHVVVNSIKRIIQSDIPIFAFMNFNITKNSSVFNNNYIKNHIMNIPVWGVENNLEEYIKPTKIINEEIPEDMTLANDDIEMTVDKTFDVTALNMLTMYIDHKNNTNEIISVTSNHCKFYYKEGIIDSPYNNPIQILKLQPEQEIKMSVQADLGTEEISGIYSATSACFFKENNTNDYDLIVESRGQLTEKRIIELSLSLLIKKLQKFIEKLPKNKGMEGTILVNGEDHTLGNMISYGMQLHSSVKFCGYNTPHPLNKQIKFHYKLDNGNLNSVIKDVVIYYERIFEEMLEQLNKLKL